MFKKIQAFTLVELIVVITILVILGTIAFISLEGYSRTARDSVRISDLSNIKTTLELFHINAGKYPLTTDGYDITYGGGKVWNQGIFGELTFNNVDKLDNIPNDPLTGKKYTYSVLNNRQEYELAGIMEGESVAFNKILLNQVNADEQTVSVMVTGNYNGQIVNVDKGGVTCVIALPSIITSSGTTLEEIVTNNLFVYNNYSNLPSNYNTNTKFKLLGETNLVLVNESNIDLYCGDYSELETNESLRLDFIDNFQKAYTGTQVEITGRIKEILELTIDKSNPSVDLIIYTIGIVEDIFSINVLNEVVLNNCDTNYTWNGSLCEADIQVVTCGGTIDANGTASTVTIYTQTWDGVIWTPTTLWGESQATCDFNCNANYTWNGSSCEADTGIWTEYFYGCSGPSGPPVCTTDVDTYPSCTNINEECTIVVAPPGGPCNTDYLVRFFICQ